MAMVERAENVLRVARPVVGHEHGRTRVRFAGEVAGDLRSFEVVIHGQVQPIDVDLGAACAAFFFWPAMAMGARLELEAPLPGSLKENMDVLAEIYTTWYPREFPSRVVVLAPAGPETEHRAPGHGLFFSGGVDSTYSLLRHQSSISALVFVVGFDIPIRNEGLAGEVSSMMRRAAGRFGLPLIEVSTDVREFSDAHAHWGSHYCGAAMAGVAHLLAREFGTMIIPGTLDWKDQAPFGTHPFTDPKWSSRSLVLSHDSCDVDRLEKMRTIVADGRGLEHLRVCWRNPDNAYNCCRCEKCLRALANLRALGALGAARTFPIHPSLDDLRALEIDHDLVIPFVEQTIGEATRAGDPDLAEALEAAVANHRVGRLTKVPKDFLADLPDSPVWRGQTFPALRDAVVDAALAEDPARARAKILNALDPDERTRLRAAARKPWWKIW